MMTEPSTARPPSHVVVVNDRTVAHGGATALALLSARRLAERGLPVTYLSGDGDDTALGDGIDSVALGQEPIALGGRARLAVRGWHNRAAAALVARRVADDDGTTVYHVHGWTKILSPSIFEALVPVAPRVVVHAHDYFLACPNGAYMDYRAGQVCTRRPLGLDCLSTHCDKRSYAQKLWRCGRQTNLGRTLADVLNGGARVVAIHEGMRDGLVRGGIPTESIRALRNPATAWTRRRVRIERNAALFYVGQVTAEKGVGEALEAARVAGLSIEVIGDGERRAALERAHPEARFHGRLSREAIAGQVVRARAVVVPSRYPEPFGLVIAEAVSSGIPVVLPDSALLAGDVAHGRLGVVYRAGDRAALGAALGAITGLDGADAEALSRRARATRLGITEDDWIDALLTLYGQCLIRDRPPLTASAR